MVLSGIIFDMDGVLVDSEPLHSKSWDLVLREFGIHFAPDWFDPWIGVPDKDLAFYLVGELDVPVDAGGLLARKRGRYRQLVDAELVAFPGIMEGIRRLSPMPMAVATSSRRPDVDRGLAKVGLGGLFNAIVTIDDVAAGKPDPEPYRLAAQRLGLAPSTCVALEDSPAGVRSAVTAGCMTIGIRSSHPDQALAGAHRIVATVADALDWVYRCRQGETD